MRAILLALAFAIAIPASLSAEAVVAKETLVSDKAAGEFDVKIAPVSQADEVLSRFSIDKQYHGDLVATGVGQMMASRDEPVWWRRRRVWICSKLSPATATATR